MCNSSFAKNVFTRRKIFIFVLLEEGNSILTIIHKVILTDIVRIRNGEVCYWSNLGYGKFDKKITLLGNERRTGHVKALYYDENLINHLPWGVGISIVLSIIEVGYGDEIEKWIR